MRVLARSVEVGQESFQVTEVKNCHSADKSGVWSGHRLGEVREESFQVTEVKNCHNAEKPGAWPGHTGQVRSRRDVVSPHRSGEVSNGSGQV